MQPRSGLLHPARLAEHHTRRLRVDTIPVQGIPGKFSTGPWSQGKLQCTGFPISPVLGQGTPIGSSTGSWGPSKFR